jgi:hypothetical protein
LRTQPETTPQTPEEPKKKSFLPYNKKNFKKKVEACPPKKKRTNGFLKNQIGNLP